MVDVNYKVYLNNIWFDSLYDADYYNDKPNFFAHGAKQFFTIYQILRNGDLNFVIVEIGSGDKLEFNDSASFKNWVKENYNYFTEHLDMIYWDRQPESKLK